MIHSLNVVMPLNYKYHIQVEELGWGGVADGEGGNCGGASYQWRKQKKGIKPKALVFVFDILNGFIDFSSGPEKRTDFKSLGFPARY